MGHPRRRRKTYKTPQHPFNKEDISSGAATMKDYGLRNKKEIWKAETKLRSYRHQARALQADKTEARTVREKEFMTKLIRNGIVEKGSTIDTVLSLQLGSVLDRRLQTMVFKKGLALSPKQARQFITHGNISVRDKRVNVPSYVVKVKDQEHVGYYGKSMVLLKSEISKASEEITEKEREHIQKPVAEAPAAPVEAPKAEGEKK